MITPFVADTFSLSRDILHGHRMASLYINPEVCKNVCGRCAVREWKDLDYRLMNVEEYVKELLRYSLLGVGLISIRGGDLTNRGLIGDQRVLENCLRMARKVAPTRVWLCGSKHDAVEGLLPFASGFRVDIKIPPFDKLTERDRTLWTDAIGVGRCVDVYVKSVKSIVEMVDGMPETYYTSTNWRDMDAGCRELMLDYLSRYKSPFLIENTETVIEPVLSYEEERV